MFSHSLIWQLIAYFLTEQKKSKHTTRESGKIWSFFNSSMFNTCIRLLIVQRLLFLFINHVLYQCLRHCMWNNVLKGCCLNWIIVHNFKFKMIASISIPFGVYAAVNFSFRLILYFLCFKFINIITISKANGKIKINWDEKLTITNSLIGLRLDKKNYVCTCKCSKCGNGCCRISENQN